MTLIITALDPTKIVQVSDQRLTLDGRSYDDHALKAIFMKSSDAATCISYTGRAFIGPRVTRTDLWLCDNLQPRTSLPLPELVESLGKRLSAVDLCGDSLTIVGASYKDGTSWPLLFIVSNVHDLRGNRLASVAKQFTVVYWAPSEKPKDVPVLLHIAGAEDVLNRSLAGTYTGSRRRGSMWQRLRVRLRYLCALFVRQVSAQQSWAPIALASHWFPGRMPKGFIGRKADTLQSSSYRM